jgi:hypothetical protein
VGECADPHPESDLLARGPLHHPARSVTFDTMSGRWVSWPGTALSGLRRRRPVHRRQRTGPRPLSGVLMAALPFIVGSLVAIALAAYLT